MIRRLCLLALFINMASNVLAFYNPSTGRWLSRDPIEERGGKNLYGFVKEPLRQTDFLGLRTITLAEQAGACDNACEKYRLKMLTSNPGWQVSGKTICCGGKKYSCAYGQNQLKNSRAKTLVENCITQHELAHFGHTAPCAPCDWEPKGADFVAGNFYGYECEAHKTSQSCLQNALQECGGEPQCVAEIIDALDWSDAKLKYYCGMAQRTGGTK